MFYKSKNRKSLLFLEFIGVTFLGVAIRGSSCVSHSQKRYGGKHRMVVD